MLLLSDFALLRRLRNLPLGLLLCCALAAGMPRAGRAQAPNLLANPGFESGAAGWKTCGGAALVDAQASGPGTVHSGRYAVQFRNPSSTTGCPPQPSGWPAYIKAPQAVWQSVAIPATAPAVTVSLWYWVDGTPATNLDVILGSDLYPGYSSTFAGAELEDVSAFTLPGWQLYRRVLKPAELAAVRGKTLLLALRLNDDLDTGENLIFRIDDVQVVAADARTAAVPLPPALRGNGTRPIAYIRSDPGNAFSGRLWRMDTDGQHAGQIYAGQLSDVAGPAWSRSGTQIAFIDGNTWPAGETDPNKYVPASALRVVDADGSNLRTVTETGGKPGSPCPVPPGTIEIADLIIELTGLSWAPDDRSIVAANFPYLRYCNNTIDGGVAQVERVPAAGGAGSMLLNYATAPQVSREGRIVFEAYDLQGSFRNESVWLYDAAAQPAEQLLLANKSFDSDGDPVWMPDGRQFVTIRPTTSYRVEAGGSTTRNQAIMLFDRQDLANPRMLLLADHGAISNLAVSPDGAYVLYTLRTVEGTVGKNNIWWLDSTTGATGPVTSDGQSSQADWRQAGGSSALPRRVAIPFALR